MNGRHHILCVVGTRPEAIKMAPVIRALGETSWARCSVVATAQHREMLDQMLGRLAIDVADDLDLMVEGQQAPNLLGRMLPSLDAILNKGRVDAVLAQGDTTTVLASALVAFLRGIPFGHVEAGLRTHDLQHPFPEEGYRQMIARIAEWHFAPTECAAKNLRNEGVAAQRIYVTGNTGIDALLQTAAELGPVREQSGRLLLLTAHRRENFGSPLRNIFAAIRELINRFPDLNVVYPVHPNPNVRLMAHELLAGNPRISLKGPLDYFEFVDLMRKATLILTDSGGIQEEAPALGKPVLVLRDKTERPEALISGGSKLVGTETCEIVKEASALLSDPALLAEMSQKRFHYGDGSASSLIVQILSDCTRRV